VLTFATFEVSQFIPVTESNEPCMQTLDADENPNLGDALPTSDPVEVIDLDTYNLPLCTCPILNANHVSSPPSRIVFALPATLPRGRPLVTTSRPPPPLDGFEYAARQKLRRYFAQRYRRLRFSDLLVRALARVSPRRSPRLQKS